MEDGRGGQETKRDYVEQVIGLSSRSFGVSKETRVDEDIRRSTLR